MLNPVGPFSGVNRNNLLSDGKVCWSLADVAHKRLLIYDHKVILWRYGKEERVMVVCFLAKKIIKKRIILENTRKPVNKTLRLSIK